MEGSAGDFPCKHLCMTLYSLCIVLKSLSEKPIHNHACMNEASCMHKHAISIIVTTCSYLLHAACIMPSKNTGIADNSNSWRIEFNQHNWSLAAFKFRVGCANFMHTISRPASSLKCAFSNACMNQHNYADKICFIHHACLTISILCFIHVHAYLQSLQFVHMHAFN